MVDRNARAEAAARPLRTCRTWTKATTVWLIMGLTLAVAAGSCNCDPRDLGLGARVLPMSSDQPPSVDDLVQVVYKYYPRWHPGKEPLDNYLVGYHHTPEIVALRTQVARVLGNDDKWRALLADVRDVVADHQVIEGSAPTYNTPSFQLIITLDPPDTPASAAARSEDAEDENEARDDTGDRDSDEHAEEDPQGGDDPEAPTALAEASPLSGDSQDSADGAGAPTRQLIFRLSHLAPVYDYHETEHTTKNQAAIAMHLAPTTEAGPVVSLIERQIARHFGYHRIAPEAGKTPIIEVGVGSLRPGEATLADALFDASRRF